MVKTIPGIGECSAMMLLAEIGDLGTLWQQKRRCAVTPGLGAGGAGVGGQGGAGRIHAGRDRERAALDHGGSGAGGDRAVRRRPSVIMNGWLRKKHKHVARVALARKLLIAVYALLHDGVEFDRRKVCGECKGNPSARSHPCSSRATLRWSGGVRTYLMCLEHE